MAATFMPGQFRLFLKHAGHELALGIECWHPAHETESVGLTSEAERESGGQVSARACAYDGHQARWPDGPLAPWKKPDPPSGALRCLDTNRVGEAPPFGVAQQLGTALFSKPQGGVRIQVDLRQLGLHYAASRAPHGMRREDDAHRDI